MGTFIGDIPSGRELGTLIRQERKAQRLTQEQLAALTGVGPRFIRELEAGKESCQLGRALLVLSALGLRLAVSRRGEAAG
ncbi:MAG: type II toxin-antitoxin system Y4mF family antitoxin [Burkholderiaceae bacterium]